MVKIHVSICDDIKQVCEAYKDILDMEDDIECVALFYDSKSCLNNIKRVNPDVLLLDVQMERETSGIDIILELKEMLPELKIIMLTSFENEDYVFKALVNGADNYVVKSLDNTELINKIRNAYNNTNSLKPEILEKFKHKSKELSNSHESMLYFVNQIVKLSVGEFEILKDIYRGETYKNIAKKRCVEETTIKSTAWRISQKMGGIGMKKLISQLKALKFFDSL